MKILDILNKIYFYFAITVKNQDIYLASVQKKFNKNLMFVFFACKIIIYHINVQVYYALNVEILVIWQKIAIHFRISLFNKLVNTVIHVRK